VGVNYETHRHALTRRIESALDFAISNCAERITAGSLSIPAGTNRNEQRGTQMKRFPFSVAASRQSAAFQQNLKMRLSTQSRYAGFAILLQLSPRRLCEPAQKSPPCLTSGVLPPHSTSMLLAQ